MHFTTLLHANGIDKKMIIDSARLFKFRDFVAPSGKARKATPDNQMGNNHMNTSNFFFLCITLFGMLHLSAMVDDNSRLNSIYRKLSFSDVQLIEQEILPETCIRGDRILAQAKSTTPDQKLRISVAHGNQTVLIQNKKTNAIIHSLSIPYVAQIHPQYPLLHNVNTPDFISAHFSPDGTMAIAMIRETDGDSEVSIKHTAVWDTFNAKLIWHYTKDGPFRAYFNNDNTITIDYLHDQQTTAVRRFLLQQEVNLFGNLDDDQKLLLLLLDTQQKTGGQDVFLDDISTHHTTDQLRKILSSFTPDQQQLIIRAYNIQDIRPGLFEKIITVLAKTL